MCMCLDIVWSVIYNILCCNCLRVSEGDRRRKKKKKKKISPSDSSKDKEKSSDNPKRRVTLEGQKRSVSEISEEELYAKYKVVLKDQTLEDYLKSKNYEISEEKLGKGGYGMVYKALRYLSNGIKETIAVKTMDLSTDRNKKIENSLKNELFVIQTLMEQIHKLRNNHIIRFYDRFLIEYIDPKIANLQKTALIFMEFADEGNLELELQNLKEPMTDSMAKRYFAQMIYAVEYLHGLYVAHRDIKLNNFLLMKSKTAPKEKVVKLTDFGLSKVQYKDKEGYILLARTGGTKCYKSPEMLENQLKGTKKLFNVYKTDIWALGVCLFQMLTDRNPFNDNLMIALKDQKNKNINYPKNPKYLIDNTAKDLIERLLDPDPEKRPDISSVKQHQWLEGETSLSITTQTTN